MRVESFFLISLATMFGFGIGQENNEELVWKKAFSLNRERELSEDNLVTTLPKLTKEWKVSFDLNPAGSTPSAFSNVLHMTIGGKGLGSSAKVGDRTPCIWVHKTHGVVVSSALNGKAAVTKKFKDDLPPAGQWTGIEVMQSLIEGKYMYSISIAGKSVLKVENTKPVELTNVKVYAGSPFYTARKGLLRNLEIEIKVPNCVLTSKMHFQ